MSDSLFSIVGLPIPAAVAQDLDVGFSPVDAPAMERAEDGTLIDFSIPQLVEKYRLSVGCDQVWTLPPLSKRWAGHAVTVACPMELAGTLDAGETVFVLDRYAVDGSVRIYHPSDPEAEGPTFTLGEDGLTVTLDAAQAGPVLVACRPLLSMRIVNWTGSLKEWRADTGWTLQLEEI